MPIRDFFKAFENWWLGNKTVMSKFEYLTDRSHASKSSPIISYFYL